MIRRELAAGVALGCLLGMIGFGRIVIWQAVAKSYGKHYLLVALTIAPGAECIFRLDTRKVCIFDPTTEKLINSPL